MAYYFMVEEKIGKYQPIIIDNNILYQIKRKQYVKPGAYGLKEIDMFTSMFENELSLREFLLNQKLLTPAQKDKPLSIRFYKNDYYNRVNYGFLYRKDKEYLTNPKTLYKYIIDIYSEEDYTFIKKIAEHFSHHYECAATATDVMWGVTHTIDSGTKHELLTRRDENGDLPIARLIKLIIYKSTRDYSGNTIYKTEINYRNLHELIAFINNYNKPKEPVYTKPKVKTLTKSKEIEGQIKLDI